MFLNPTAKLLYHGDRIKKWLSKEITSPVLVEISPTGYCNANCPWCFFQNKKTSERIDTEVLLRAISDFSIMGLKAINWTGGGEPTLHPDFDKFIEKAYLCGIEQGIFTNAYKEIPCQDKFKWIRISLTDKEFEPIKKPRVPFGICCNMTPETEVERLCKEARDFGAVYFQVRPALVGNYREQPQLDEPTYLKKFETEKFKVYTTPYKFAEATKPRGYDKCYGYHLCPSIDWRGHLAVCLYMAHYSNYILGDLNKESAMKIWKNKYKVAIACDKCQNCCKNHEINKLLYQTKNVEHENFL